MPPPVSSDQRTECRIRTTEPPPSRSVPTTPKPVWWDQAPGAKSARAVVRDPPHSSGPCAPSPPAPGAPNDVPTLSAPAYPSTHPVRTYIPSSAAKETTAHDAAPITRHGPRQAGGPAIRGGRTAGRRGRRRVHRVLLRTQSGAERTGRVLRVVARLPITFSAPDPNISISRLRAGATSSSRSTILTAVHVVRNPS